VNGDTRELDIDPQMPLLWASAIICSSPHQVRLRHGAVRRCTVHIDGQATRSCVTPVAAVQGKQITTIEA